MPGQCTYPTEQTDEDVKARSGEAYFRFEDTSISINGFSIIIRLIWVIVVLLPICIGVIWSIGGGKHL